MVAVPSPTTSVLLPQVNILCSTKFVFKSLNDYTFHLYGMLNNFDNLPAR
jgi:hypothetical protein